MNASDNTLVLQIYDVGNHIRLISKAVKSGTGDHEEKIDVADEMWKHTENLADIIRDFIQPPLVENREEVKAIGASSLVALVRPKQHEWIQSFLETRRSAGDVQFLVELTYYALSPGAFNRLMGEKGSKVALTIADEKSKKLLDECQKDKESCILSAPRLLVNNGRKGIISIINQIALITGYEVHVYVEPTKNSIVDPQIEILQEGLIIDVRASLLQENNIGLNLSSKNMMIQRPIEEIETVHGPVARAATKTVEMETMAILKDTGSMIYAIPGKDKDNKNHVILLTVKLVQEKELPDLEF